MPLPVFYEADGKPILSAENARKVADLVEKHGTNLWFEKSDADCAQMLGLPDGTTWRNDTLDVWIDSGVSHTAVTAKRPELAGSSVADVYIEATDQHRGWFQSSLMTSVALYGKAPYKTVITHGFVVDADTKKKVSKSDQTDAGQADGTPAGNAAAKPNEKQKEKDYVKPTKTEHYCEKSGKKTSVHLELFPEADAALRDTALEAQVDELLKLRGVIAQAIEPARQAKEIGNALEGAVTLQLADEKLLATLQGRAEELEELFILSDLPLTAGGETNAKVVRTERAKCARCWRHRVTVGADPAQPELCDRCTAVVTVS